MQAISPERLRGVATDISAELERLRRGAEDIAFARAEIARNPGHARMFYENLAFKLHNFYTGCKRMVQTVASELNGAPPGGFDRHRRLLGRMGAAWGDRPAVLSGDSVEGLHEFLAFRYVVKNLYGRELDAETDRTPDHLLPGCLRPEHR
ncbi:MAG: hypothetical protein C0183_22595 [Roseiflexus castenholzii]|uniref:ribonuclease toxin HepT-like protein n=1 Tax=Roseiflexus castenholzii TaxID=120962 RepID=UPI000CB15633|nr:MAG: hypothetical protein C0183_22595 [Roseiflexus castenholzii]